MKSVSLGQQGSLVDARSAGRELLGSTFLAGCFAALFWGLLGHQYQPVDVLRVDAAVRGVFCQQALPDSSLHAIRPSYWLNVATTMLILLGPAVEDSASGKDVYMAFAVRMGLFVAVTLYAWLAVYAAGAPAHTPYPSGGIIITKYERRRHADQFTYRVCRLWWFACCCRHYCSLKVIHYYGQSPGG